MDWSDEMDEIFNTCELDRVAIECMERLCLPLLYSCGDGTCVPASARFAFQTFTSPNPHCLNLRELSYMCETNPSPRLWTKPNGLCSFQIGYDDPTQDMRRHHLSSVDVCTYLIRCALSMGYEADCPCDRNCSTVMKGICNIGQLYAYPTKGLIRPWLLQIQGGP
jgi:hypothetical protein